MIDFITKFLKNEQNERLWYKCKEINHWASMVCWYEVEEAIKKKN